MGQRPPLMMPLPKAPVKGSSHVPTATTDECHSEERSIVERMNRAETIYDPVFTPISNLMGD